MIASVVCIDLSLCLRLYYIYIHICVCVCVCIYIYVCVRVCACVNSGAVGVQRACMEEGERRKRAAPLSVSRERS
jgi:hypothetical protein